MCALLCTLSSKSYPPFSIGRTSNADYVLWCTEPCHLPGISKLSDALSFAGHPTLQPDTLLTLHGSAPLNAAVVQDCDIYLQPDTLSTLHGSAPLILALLCRTVTSTC